MTQAQTTAPEAAPAQDDTKPADPNFVMLDKPILRGKTSISSITLRRPSAGELRGLSLIDLAQMNVTALQKLLPRISEPMLIEADVAGMDLADLVACGTQVATFLLSKRDRQQFL